MQPTFRAPHHSYEGPRQRTHYRQRGLSMIRYDAAFIWPNILRRGLTGCVERLVSLRLETGEWSRYRLSPDGFASQSTSSLLVRRDCSRGYKKKHSRLSRLSLLSKTVGSIPRHLESCHRAAKSLRIPDKGQVVAQPLSFRRTLRAVSSAPTKTIGHCGRDEPIGR